MGCCGLRAGRAGRGDGVSRRCTVSPVRSGALPGPSMCGLIHTGRCSCRRHTTGCASGRGQFSASGRCGRSSVRSRSGWRRGGGCASRAGPSQHCHPSCGVVAKPTSAGIPGITAAVPVIGPGGQQVQLGPPTHPARPPTQQDQPRAVIITVEHASPSRDTPKAPVQYYPHIPWSSYKSWFPQRSPWDQAVTHRHRWSIYQSGG